MERHRCLANAGHHYSNPPHPVIITGGVLPIITDALIVLPDQDKLLINIELTFNHGVMVACVCVFFYG